MTSLKTAFPAAGPGPDEVPRLMPAAEVAATMTNHYGVPVAWIGEDAVALGQPISRVLAALHRLGRTTHLSPMYVGAISPQWARFERVTGDAEAQWVMYTCDASTDGAMEVTVAHQLVDYTPGARHVDD